MYKPWTWLWVGFEILPLSMILSKWTLFTTFKTVPPFPLARYSNASDMILELFLNNTPIKVLYNDNNSIKWCYSFFISSFILVSHAVIVSVVRRYLLSDNVLEANMKLSFYLFTLRCEHKITILKKKTLLWCPSGRFPCYHKWKMARSQDFDQWPVPY